MVSFLKRRKSSIVASEKTTGGQASSSSPPPLPPPVPASALHAQARQVRTGKPDLAMPDLRFSSLDLDSHVQSVGSATTTTTTTMKDRPKSRLFSFGRSTDDLPKQHHAHHQSNSHTVRARNPNAATPNPAAAHKTLPRSFQAPQQAHSSRPPVPLPIKSPTRATSNLPTPPPPASVTNKTHPKQSSVATPSQRQRQAPNMPPPPPPAQSPPVHRPPAIPLPPLRANAHSSSAALPAATSPALATAIASAAMTNKFTLDPSPSVGSSTTTTTTTTTTSVRGDAKHRSSLDTDGSVDGGNSSSFVTSDEQAVDTQSPVPSVHRVRPARDEEREERAQSRLSMALEGEVLRNEGKASSIASSSKRTAQVPYTTNAHQRNESNASRLSTFSAMLMASRPGGAADRSVDEATKQREAAEEEEQRQRRAQYYRNGNAEQSILVRSGLVKGKNVEPEEELPASLSTMFIKRIRESLPVTQPRMRVVQPSLRCSGEGWECMGVGDVRTVDSHWRSVIETIKVAHVREKEEEEDDNDDESLVDGGVRQRAEPEIEYVDEEVETHYNDLFELLFTSTTPDLIARLLSHVEIGDIKALRQVSSAVRLSVGAQRETLLDFYLGSIGYRTWSHVRGSATAYRARMAGQLPSNANKDPCPLSLQDLEAFLIAQDLLPEYAIVGREYSLAPHAMDPGIARLARATTRAHNRILTRLRVQPVYKPTAKKAASSQSPSPKAAISRQNSYYDARKAADLSVSSFNNLPPIPTLSMTPSPLSHSPVSPSGSFVSSPMDLSTAPSSPMPETSKTAAADVEEQPALVSPWKPGRAAHFRVWVPAHDPSGWLSDEELAQCEQELYKSGIWPHLKRGDIVWDTAVGDQLNEGKYVFDGHYLRDLSYAFDVAGHLPSWLNVVMFSPSYWHNVIRSSMPQPVVHLDVSPWRDQILNSLRLVQDQVDTFSGHGARYRIAKWLYRSAANVTHGQIVSRMNGGLEIVDEGWHGRIVIEMDGTAEMAKLLVARCAGADASAQEKAALLATVMGDPSAVGKLANTHDTNGLATLGRPIAYNKFSTAKTLSSSGKRSEPQTSAWAIMRERSRPGLIWLRPLGEREKVTA